MADDKIKTDSTLPDISSKDAEAAKTQGIKDALAESAADRFRATDGVAQNDTGPERIILTNDAMPMAHLLDLAPDELKKTLTGKGDGTPNTASIPSKGQIASLLEMERSSRNRADTVEVLCDVLGIKSPYEVTNAGPAYTNVVNRKVLERG
jgi:hypothetical protein